MQADKVSSTQAKKDKALDGDTGGMLYQQLRKLISIVVSTLSSKQKLRKQKLTYLTLG
jgi:hypothetical protein